MNENIFDEKRLKTFSNCIDLVKSMVGTREGLIAYNQRFRIDLENTCYKASMYDDLQQKIDKAIENIKEYKELGYSKYDENEIEIELIDKILEILGGENNR